MADYVPKTTITYDANGNVLTVTDPRGIVTKTSYDAWNCVTQVIRAFGTAAAVTNSTTYDANNNILTVTLHNGAFGDQTTTYAFDEFDRKTQETLPAIGDGQTRRTLWTYYQNGTVKTVTDAKNQTTENEYDLDNRLTLLRLKQTGGTVAEVRTFTYNNVDKPLGSPGSTP